MYAYNGVVTRIVDADTVDVEIFLGFYVKCNQRLRLLGIDAPEVRGPEKVEGKAAAEWLRELIPVGCPIKVQTFKTGKYGRWIATIFKGEGDDQVNINDALVEAGHAVESR